MIFKYIKKFSDAFFGTRAAGMYILIFAASIGIATFIENDFGTSSAQKVVFRTKWFELLMLLFSATLVANIIRFRMIENRKWALVMFHTSMIIILFGAGLTRYFGYEGMMHIREGEAANTFLSAETYLQFEAIHGGNKFEFDEHVLFATLGNNNWEKSYVIGNDKIDVAVKEFIPNPKQSIVDNSDGAAVLKVVFGSSSGREEYYLKDGQKKRIKNVLFNFGNSVDPSAVNLSYRDNNLMIQSSLILYQTVMATQTKDTLYPNEGPHMLRLRSLYSDGKNGFVFGDFNPSADIVMASEGPKVKNESMTALKIAVRINGEIQEHLVFGKKGIPGRPVIYRMPNTSLAISYGAKPITIPFKIKLREFIMERYPGTNSAASYASEIQLIDQPKDEQFDFRIFMNNILTYRGYRFFQSSFDKDEKGTYLSVNSDFWGTWVSYLGYFLLTLGLIMTFFSKKTRFTQVRNKLKQMRKESMVGCIAILFLMMSNYCVAQETITPQFTSVSPEHAALFSHTIVQDQRGRMKPMHTMTREVMRKISRTESLYGLTADQMILNMFADKQSWLAVPLIKLSDHAKIKELIATNQKHAAYRDFFLPSGAYKLREEVRRAYGLQPIDRGTFEKELMKLDERINIVSMIFSGRLFKLIPVLDDPNNTWVATKSGQHGNASPPNPVADKFFSSYRQALLDAQSTHDYSLPNQLLSELRAYQVKHGEKVSPSNAKIGFEIFLNRLNVFSRLSLYYSILGLCFLALLLFSVFRESKWSLKIFKTLKFMVIAGFALHTLGLAIRWYVSGRAPWSNGYESMIYIAWTSTLAGMIFTRKSVGGLAATMILAGSILLVAMLSYLDPEITPLVPVLKSYWLTIHVSLIAGSYGFLMLGAIIGFINLILIILANKNNQAAIKRQITELTYISEITLIGGLAMISIGTYLGGVWANESWGRYWGWDAKETWALVTILVYAFILHMRFIPGLRGLYSFNLATLFGMASVIMTYFGVNYYLSGLHSYAAGDPIPIPNWVYYAVAAAIVVSVLAFFRKKKVVGL